MKKLLALFVVSTILLSLVACGNKKQQGFKIPDVFGLNYTDATSVLEGEGFTVTAIESNADSFSEKLLTPLEEVEKGSVFKIDDYILDGDGDLNLNYDWLEDGEEMVSDDQSIVIYYAKEDYKAPADETDGESEEPETDETDDKSEEPETESKSSTSSKETKKEDTSAANDDKIGSDFKSAMDSYESFMDEYVDFMKKYNANPTDLSLLTEYSSFMSDYAKFVSDFEKWEDEDLNTAELAYYLDVQTRVSKKLLEVTQ